VVHTVARRSPASWPGVRYAPVSTLAIRTFGDPVLRQRAREVEVFDGRLAKLAEDMIATMYAAPGCGLAATQVGIERRLFVYDWGDGPDTIVNPEIVESDGEWAFVEGCLSIPGLSWEVVRPNSVHLRGRNLDGEEVDFEVDEFEGRVFQHELDHLDGVLYVERLDDDQRKQVMKILRTRALGLEPMAPPEPPRRRRGGETREL
jgi:peptide deformylase